MYRVKVQSLALYYPPKVLATAAVLMALRHFGIHIFASESDVESTESRLGEDCIKVDSIAADDPDKAGDWIKNVVRTDQQDVEECIAEYDATYGR